MHSLWQDVKYGARTLSSRPGFTLVAILTLAVGIGANTAIFTVVNSLLFEPLPVEDADRLVIITETTNDAIPHDISYLNLQDYEKLDVFESIVGETVLFGQFKGEGEPERVVANVTTADFFSELGIEAAHGRVWNPDEGRRGMAGDVIVLGHGFWERRFAADPSVIGRTVHLSSRPVTIIGIVPPEFRGTIGFVEPEIYVPIAALPYLTDRAEELFEERDASFLRAIGKLAPGVSIEEARQALEAMSRRLAEEYPETNSGVMAAAYPEPMARMEPSAVAYLPPIATVFMVLVGFVLLIACANVANLLLARASVRSKEIAVRSALGAGRLRIVRQLLTESVLLAVLGGVAGLGLSYAATEYLETIRIATDLDIQFTFSPDLRVFGFAFLAALVAGVVAGLFPGFQAARSDLADALKEGGRGAGAGRHRLRNGLVVAQVGISMALLICTALFVQSARNVAGMDLGFARENRLIMTMDVGLADMDEPRGRNFYRQLIDRVEALPGVRQATTASFVPISIYNGVTQVWVEGYQQSDNKDGRILPNNIVNVDYFETIGTPIVRGRGFTERDDESGRPVAVVNEKFAETYWPGQDPIGKRISTESAKGPFMEVVGVAKNGVYNLPGETTPPYIYRPFRQNYSSSQVLHVHTEGDPLAVLPRVRQEIRALAPDLPLFDVRTMETHLAEGKGTLLFNLASGLVGSFGLIGLLLAAVGLYGVISYSVAQRTQEIGIRMALGAGAARILTLVLRQGLMLALIGVALGCALAYPVTNLLANFLVGVGPHDIATFAAVGLVLVLVALLASFIPARFRALQVDPIVALRSE